MIEHEQAVSGLESAVADKVLQQVQESGVAPIDRWHLSALLEMEGWSDSTARDLGYPDMFALTQAIYPHVSRAALEPAPVSAAAQSTSQQWCQAARHFSRAVLYAVPILMVAAAFLLTRRTSAQGLSSIGRAEAGVALATWLSFLVTGGFQQAIVVRGRALMELSEFGLARRLCVPLLGLAGAVSLGSALLLIRLTDLHAAALHLALCLFWLSGSLLRALGWDLAFLIMAGTTAGLLWLGGSGTATVLYLMAGANLWVGLWWMRRQERKRKGRPAPREALDWLDVAPHFVLGLALFAYLLQDRIWVWITGLLTNTVMTSTAYELSMLLAALAFIFPAGIAEVHLYALALTLRLCPAALCAREYGAFRRQAIHAWLLAQARVLAAGMVSAWFILGLVRWLSTAPGVELLQGSAMVGAFRGGLAGYALMPAGLLHVSLLTALGQTRAAIGVLVAAASASLAAGVLLARLAHLPPAMPFGVTGYPFAAVGVVAGAAALWGLGAWLCWRTLTRIDYLLYQNT